MNSNFFFSILGVDIRLKNGILILQKLAYKGYKFEMWKTLEISKKGIFFYITDKNTTYNSLFV